MVEHSAVNRRVAGSSPARGAILSGHSVCSIVPAFFARFGTEQLSGQRKKIYLCDLDLAMNPKNAIRKFTYSLNPAIHLIAICFFIETRFKSSVCLYAITRYGFLVGFSKNTCI